MVRPRSCRVIYYFDTPALGIRYQSFDRVNMLNVKHKRQYISEFMRFLKIYDMLNVNYRG